MRTRAQKNEQITQIRKVSFWHRTAKAEEGIEFVFFRNLVQKTPSNHRSPIHS
jgi:hypothetical protein